jgi:hypothetical protein
MQQGELCETAVYIVRYKPILTYNAGARVSVVVKALCYKAEGGGFETR